MMPDASCPGFDQLEAQGFRVGTVEIRQLPIFDDEAGLPKLYRWADRLHVDTDEDVIESQLLFRPGDPISRRRIEETERNLRNLRFVREPSVSALRCAEGIADLAVTAHEVWTTNPGISFNRSGGANSAGFKFEELNLFGRGKELSLELSANPDRSFYTVHWRDPSVGGSRWINDLAVSESDDGHGWHVILERPFYALDSHWSTGVALQQEASIEPVYRLGERVAGFSRDADFAEARFGLSGGLHDGWARRLTFGLRREHATFGAAPDEPGPAVMPADRRLDYPYLRFEAVQDSFETARNRDQIARTEDQEFGLRYALELGWSTPWLGADRNAALMHADISRGWHAGVENTVFAGAAVTTRIEGGSLVDSLASAGVRFYHPTGPQTVLFASFQAAVGHDLDGDHELTLGGDTGLRGYPLRYQAGSATALMTVEQRIFTRYSLWKLADVGAAVFFDVGKAWGEPPLGPAANFGLLKDVGFGVRLGSKRSALGNVVHFDVAFPLDGHGSIDSVQFLVQTKQGF